MSYTHYMRTICACGAHELRTSCVAGAHRNGLCRGIAEELQRHCNSTAEVLVRNNGFVRRQYLIVDLIGRRRVGLCAIKGDCVCCVMRNGYVLM
jgi:hypothetical protein